MEGVDYEDIPLEERVVIGRGHSRQPTRVTNFRSDHDDYINFADLPSRAARRSGPSGGRRRDQLQPPPHHYQPRSHDRRKSSLRYGTFNARLRRRYQQGEDVTDEAVNMYEATSWGSHLPSADDQNVSEYVRQMDIPLHEKRVVLKRITSTKADTRKRRRNISCWDNMKYNTLMRWKHMKGRVSDARYSLELWKGSLKEIEGSFGSGVLTYFMFLRWLFLINIPIWLTLVLFVVTPQIIFRVRYSGSATAYGNMPAFGASDFFTGLGWFNETEMYYGYYTGSTFDIDLLDVTGGAGGAAGGMPTGATGNTNITDDNVTMATTTMTVATVTDAVTMNGSTGGQQLPYNMQYAYMFTCAACYLLYFIILAVSVAQSYALSHISSTGTSSTSREHKLHNVYTNKIICGWDFGITQSKAAEQRHRAIKRDLEECLAGLRSHEGESSGCCDRTSHLTIQIFSNFLILASYVCIYFLLDLVYSRTRELAQDDRFRLLLPGIISLINRFMPYLFAIVASKENYRKPATKLYATMTRTILLKALTIGLLIVLSYRESTCTTDKCRTQCWENTFGATIYQLVIIDFIITFILTCAEFVRGWVCSLFASLHKYSKTEFDISRNTLHLIYLQALSWVGAFFSPLLPFIVWILLLLLFYTRKLSLLYNYSSSGKPWRSTHTHTAFLFFLSYAYLLTMCATGYAITTVEPSAGCGPYQGEVSVYNATVLTSLDVLKAQTALIEIIVEILTSPGSIIFCLALLCVGVYYFTTLAEGAREMEEKVKEQLVWEGKDKLYLMNLIHRRYSRQVRQQQHGMQHMPQQHEHMPQQHMQQQHMPQQHMPQQHMPQQQQQHMPHVTHTIPEIHVDAPIPDTPHAAAGMNMNESHGGINESHGGINESHGGINESHGGINESHGGINESHGGINESHGGMNEAHGGINAAHGGINEARNINRAYQPESFTGHNQKNNVKNKNPNRKQQKRRP